MGPAITWDKLFPTQHSWWDGWHLTSQTFTWDYKVWFEKKLLQKTTIHSYAPFHYADEMVGSTLYNSWRGHWQKERVEKLPWYFSAIWWKKIPAVSEMKIFTHWPQDQIYGYTQKGFEVKSRDASPQLWHENPLELHLNCSLQSSVYLGKKWCFGRSGWTLCHCAPLRSLSSSGTTPKFPGIFQLGTGILSLSLSLSNGHGRPGRSMPKCCRIEKWMTFQQPYTKYCNHYLLSLDPEKDITCYDLIPEYSKKYRRRKKI